MSTQTLSPTFKLGHGLTQDEKKLSATKGAPIWKNYEKILFRFFFIYLFIQVVPLDWKFYNKLFTIDWFNLHFYDLFKLTQYSPQFFSADQISAFGLASYANWGVVFVIALAGTIIWSMSDKRSTQYNQLHYWLRVIIRYRLAVGLIGFGFIKLFPLQMPYPSLSNLHTEYGNFLPWKIYWHTIGITQAYESFLGCVEILAGVLLLYRKTVTFAAGLIVGFTGNVVAANFAYGGGQHVYSSYLVVLALFLFVFDIPRLYNLLALGKVAKANRFNPSFSVKWLRNTRLALKIGILVFIALYGTKTYANFKNDPYLVPKTKGVNGTYGFYNVSEFRLNDKEIPYSLTDTNRWQNVVFEKWATISIKTARRVKVDLSNADVASENDLNRSYESAGVGGRLYYSYTADTVNQALFLQNKNKHHQGEKYVLHYSFPTDSTILISGKDERNNTVYAKLDRIEKKYMLFEGRRKRVIF